jgi:MYXO-CTERM domain-containing protein
MGCDSADLTLEDASGNLVNGTVVVGGANTNFANYLIVPDTALAPGTYWVSHVGGEQREITVTDAVVEPPEFSVSLAVERDLQTWLTCSFPQGGSTNTLMLSETVRARFDIAGHGLSLGQYHYEYTVGGMVASSSTSFGEPIDEICYGIEAIPLRPGGATLNVEDDCFDDPALDTLGNYQVSDEELDSFLTLDCVIPPAEYQEKWCDLFTDAYEANSCEGIGLSSTQACESARKACPEGDLYVPREGAGASGNGGADGGITGDGDGAVDGVADPSQDVMGCACSSGSSRPSGAPTALLLVLGLLVAVRSRRIPLRNSATLS